MRKISATSVLSVSVLFLLMILAIQSVQAQTFNSIFSFNNPGANGIFPYAGLTMDRNGNLYGTNNGAGSNGYGAVYKITVGRDDLGMKEHGAVINARMGLNTWAAFVGTQEDAAIAGDVAMLENEVTPVLKALRKNGLEVVAIHNHMTGDRPVVIFLHYWGRGPAEKLATGFKAALDELGKDAPAHEMSH